MYRSVRGWEGGVDKWTLRKVFENWKLRNFKKSDKIGKMEETIGKKERKGGKWKGKERVNVKGKIG